MDGWLAKGVSWTPEEVLKAKPIQKNIDLLNEQSKEGFVIIYTARRDHLITPTIEWLRKHNVRFQAISNNKMPSDIYFDDKNA